MKPAVIRLEYGVLRRRRIHMAVEHSRRGDRLSLNAAVLLIHWFGEILTLEPVALSISIGLQYFINGRYPFDHASACLPFGGGSPA